MFDNNDDFGIDIMRDDVWNSVVSKNKIRVGLVKFNKNKSETLQGDFLGVKSNDYQEKVEDIEININSYSPLQLKLKKEGYNSRGDLTFKCYAKYDVNVLGNDLIVFYENFNYGIKAGQVFKVEMKDAGMYQGQYCWKEFDIILIREDGWEYKGEKLTKEIQTLMDEVDSLEESDYTPSSWEDLMNAYNLPFRTNPEGFEKKSSLENAILNLELVEE